MSYSARSRCLMCFAQCHGIYHKRGHAYAYYCLFFKYLAHVHVLDERENECLNVFLQQVQQEEGPKQTNIFLVENIMLISFKIGLIIGLLRARRSLQQYIINTYVKVENRQLDLCRNNQDTFIVHLYEGILDTLGSGENSAANVGRHVILPPSFLGGRRDMKKRYLNAMSLVQGYGKPDLFITMTCMSTGWKLNKN